MENLESNILDETAELLAPINQILNNVAKEVREIMEDEQKNLAKRWYLINMRRSTKYGKEVLPKESKINNPTTKKQYLELIDISRTQERRVYDARIKYEKASKDDIDTER